VPSAAAKHREIACGKTRFLPAVGVFLLPHRSKWLPGRSLEPSFGGGPRVETTEVVSLSINIDLDHDDIMYPDLVPFLAVHAGCVAAIWSGVTWQAIAICVVLYWLRMFAITGGYHRYFSHRAYATSRVFQFVLAFLAQSTAQKSVLWWAAKHRHHHLHSDTEQDAHSPRHKGFVYSRMKLTLKPDGIAVRLRGKMVDIYDFPDGRLEVRWKGRSLPYSAFDKLQRVSHAAIVENKRLGEILAWIKEQQDQQPRLNTIPKGPRRSSQASGLLKNRALRMAEAAKSKSQAPRRGRRRSDRVVSAAPAHAPSEAAE
jgi:hypothetical protein